MCVKRMSSRSCLGHLSRFAIPTLMYNVIYVTCFRHFGGGGIFVLFYHDGVSCCSLAW